jgi:hypothetical protein
VSVLAAGQGLLNEGVADESYVDLSVQSPNA